MEAPVVINRTARLLHWVMAILILFLLGLGVYMVELTYYDPDYKSSPDLHRSLGLVVFVLVWVRLAWRLKHPPPPPNPNHAPWEHFVAGATHLALYGLMLVLPITGFLISTAKGHPVEVFGLFEIPAITSGKMQEEVFGSLHAWLAYGGAGLMGLHAAGALKHHLIDKDDTLMRMIGPWGQNRSQ
ncbi:MAG: cytochrome b [Magnetococcales bacterium]|nr:cytochrome b [Magnetococcales bacterium]